MKKLAVILLPFALALFVCAKGDETYSQEGNDYPQAPEFSLEDLEGNEIALSDYSGKVVFLNFWATWCGPCRHEIPGFIAAYKKYKDKGMKIIGISLDTISSESVLKFTKKYEMNYPVAMGTKEIVEDYGPIPAIPVTVIIDKNGKLRQRKVGYLDEKSLEGWFLKLIEE
ncbi:MAG: TlpA family protein disulfide reductase [Candidatus Aminicenantes bacterium]|nr:MAG: TlpA family protein disulfide reductase [Candidatus Aminicenantes bacterium]